MCVSIIGHVTAMVLCHKVQKSIMLQYASDGQEKCLVLLFLDLTGKGVEMYRGGDFFLFAYS